LLAGIALAMAQPGLSGPSIANLASLTVLGALVALALPWPGWLMGAITCAVGVSHGYANGAAMMPEINPALYMPGVMTAGYLVILFVAAVAATATRRWPAARIAARALGSWIFAIGVMMLGASLAA
jgi:urease accessory protein